MSETILIKSVLHCSVCGADNLNVGLSMEGELVMACPACNVVVMRVREWPDAKLTSNPDGSCTRCGEHHEKCDNELCYCAHNAHRSHSAHTKSKKELN